MDTVAEVGSAVVKAAAAEGAATAVAPAAVGEGTKNVVSAVSEITPVVAEVGAEGVTTVAESSETVAAQVANIEEALANERGEAAAVTEEDNEIREGDAPEVIAQKLNRQNLAEAKKNAARAGNGSVFAREQAASMTDRELEGFHVPRTIQEDVEYKQALTDIVTERGGDESLRNDKGVQAEAYWKCRYKQTEAKLKDDKGYIDQSVTDSKEWGDARALAHQLASTLNAERKKQGEELIDEREIDKWAYVYYMEKKKKGIRVVGALKGALAFIIAGGQDAQKKLEPDLMGGGQRR